MAPIKTIKREYLRGGGMATRGRKIDLAISGFFFFGGGAGKTVATGLESTAGGLETTAALLASGFAFGFFGLDLEGGRFFSSTVAAAAFLAWTAAVAAVEAACDFFVGGGSQLCAL